MNVDKPGIWYTVHGGTVHPNNRVAVVDNESEDVVFVLFLRLPNSKNTAKELASIEAKSTGANFKWGVHLMGRHQQRTDG